MNYLLKIVDFLADHFIGNRAILEANKSLESDIKKISIDATAWRILAEEKGQLEAQARFENKNLKVMVDAQQKNIVRLQNMMEDDSFDEDDEFEPRQIISFNMIDTKPKLEPVDLKQLGFEVYLLMRGKK